MIADTVQPSVPASPPVQTPIAPASVSHQPTPVAQPTTGPAMGNKLRESGLTLSKTALGLLIGAAVVGLALMGAVGYYAGRMANPDGMIQAQPPDMVGCTADAMMCPDGSYVGREAPSCEFAPCPGTATDMPQDYGVPEPALDAGASGYNPDVPTSTIPGESLSP